MRKLRLKARATLVGHYFHLFVNRRAYTLQSNRPHPGSARHYCYRPKDKETGQGLSLPRDTIRRHIEGEITIGRYLINVAVQQLRRKPDRRNRGKLGASLLRWADDQGVAIKDGLRKEMRADIPQGDDPFDAVVGLFWMLQACLGQRGPGEPDERIIRWVEGRTLHRRS
jgi:hypothetical protein